MGLTGGRYATGQSGGAGVCDEVEAGGGVGAGVGGSVFLAGSFRTAPGFSVCGAIRATVISTSDRRRWRASFKSATWFSAVSTGARTFTVVTLTHPAPRWSRI